MSNLDHIKRRGTFLSGKIYDRYHDISLILEIDLTKQIIMDFEIEERSAAVHQFWIRDRVMKNSCFTMSEDFENLNFKKLLATEPSITSLFLGLRKGKG